MKTKIFKIAGMIVVLAGSFFSCDKASKELGCDCKDELYYYVQGEKKFFDDPYINDRLLVGFELHAQDTEIADYIAGTGFFKPVDKTHISNYPNDFFPNDGNSVPFEYRYRRLYVETKEPKACTQMKEIIRMLEESPIVAFASLTFDSGDNPPMAFTPVFYVTVKDKDDLSDLNAIAQETNTCIVERSETISATFTLVADKNSKGNMLRMANYFYETGKFERTAQGTIGGYRALFPYF